MSIIACLTLSVISTWMGPRPKSNGRGKLLGHCWCRLEYDSICERNDMALSKQMGFFCSEDFLCEMPWCAKIKILEASGVKYCIDFCLLKDADSKIQFCLSFLIFNSKKIVIEFSVNFISLQIYFKVLFL